MCAPAHSRRHRTPAPMRRTSHTFLGHALRMPTRAQLGALWHFVSHVNSLPRAATSRTSTSTAASVYDSSALLASASFDIETPMMLRAKPCQYWLSAMAPFTCSALKCADARTNGTFDAHFAQKVRATFDALTARKMREITGHPLAKRVKTCGLLMRQPHAAHQNSRCGRAIRACPRERGHGTRRWFTTSASTSLRQLTRR